MTSQKRNGKKKNGNHLNGNNGNSNRNHPNNNTVGFWNKARLFAAAGLISLPLVALGASKLIDCSKANPPKVKPLEQIVNSDLSNCNSVFNSLEDREEDLMKDLEDSLDDYKTEIDDLILLKKDLVELQAKIANTTNPAEKDRLRDDERDLKDDINQAEDDVDYAENKSDDIRSEIETVRSDLVAARLTMSGFYTDNQEVRYKIKQKISDLVLRQMGDPSVEMKVKVRDFMKLNIFGYYDFVLDGERTNEETYSMFSRIFTDIVNILPSIDPNFESYLEGRNGEVAMDTLEINSILRPYFETLGYVCMIVPDLEVGEERPNIILMEVGGINKFDVKCLDKSHTMSYREIIGVAIPFIQRYKDPRNEVDGIVVGAKGGDYVCLVDTRKERGIAESAWNALQDGSDEYMPLVRRIFPSTSKEEFISTYLEVNHRSVLVHEATHDLRRSQADKKSFHEEELIAFLNETVEGPSPLYTMLHLIRNGEAPYYKLALSKFREHVLRGDSPLTIGEHTLRERAGDYLVSFLGTNNEGEGK